MTNAVAQILSLQMTLTGVSTIQASLKRVEKTFSLTAAQVKSLTGDLMRLGIIGAAAIFGIHEAMSSQRIMADLQGFTNNLALARNQMQLINVIANQGVFTRDDLAKAFKIFDETNTPLKANVQLLKELGVRLKSVTDAARLLAKISGAGPGPVPRIYGDLMNAGITPQMLAQHGVKVVGRNVLSGKADLMRALKEITGGDSAYARQRETLGAQWEGLMNRMGRLAEVVVTPLVSGLSTVVKILDVAAKYMKDLNDLTGGWASYFLIGGVLYSGMLRLWDLMIKMKITQLYTTIYTWLQQTAYGTMIPMIKNVFMLLKGGQVVQAFLSILAAAWAAAYGNFVPIAILLAAGVATAGLAWGANKLENKFAQDEETSAMNNTVDKAPSKDLPYRHDDVENVYKRLRGFAWTG